MGKTPGRDFYDRQAAYFEAGDIDGLVSQYHDDAVIVTFDFTVRGPEAIRRHFEERYRKIKSARVKETHRFTETDDAIFFEATMATNLGETRICDVFVLKGGKATHQFSNFVGFTPK